MKKTPAQQDTALYEAALRRAPKSKRKRKKGRGVAAVDFYLSRYHLDKFREKTRNVREADRHVRKGHELFEKIKKRGKPKGQWI